MAGPESRISWIRRISEYLKNRTWTDENMVLGEFGIPEESRGGDRHDIRIRRLQQAGDQALEALWRFAQGLGPSTETPSLASASRPDLIRLWGQGSPRVFLSHRAEFKVQAKELKDELAKWGATSFVAHDDIEPTRAWQTEIERALASMDVLVALLTGGFRDSWWTNQEIGVSLGRGVPVLCVRIDEAPHGFVGQPQAIPGAGRSSSEIAKALVSVMSGQPRLSNALLTGIVIQWESARRFEEGIRVMGLLEACKTIPPDLLARIELAFEANDQLHNSSEVNRRYPSFIAKVKSAANQE